MEVNLAYIGFPNILVRQRTAKVSAYVVGQHVVGYRNITYKAE